MAKKIKPKSGKSAESNAKKAAKKELENGIAERFMDAVSSLGHDAEKIARDLKKMSKEIAKKLSANIKKEAGKVARKSSKEEKARRREVKPSGKAIDKPSRAERVVAKVSERPAERAEAKLSPRLISMENIAVRPANAPAVSPDSEAPAPAEGSSPARAKRVVNPGTAAPVPQEKSGSDADETQPPINDEENKGE